MNSSSLITDAQKAEMRQKNFEESKLDTTKNKYGLFSFAGTLAILPNPYEKRTAVRRNSDGMVITEPRNFMTSPGKTGKNSDALFSPTSFITTGEKYKDPPRSYLSEKIRAERMRKSHDVAFKPTGPTDTIAHIEYISPDKPRVKRRRDSEGNVIFDAKNFYTSPSKKGAPSVTPGVNLGNDFEHIPDPFDRGRELKKKERIEHHKKMPDRPFKSTSIYSYPFNKDQEVFDLCEDVKKAIKKKKPGNIMPHDAPFKPTDNGKSHVVDAVFGEIPEYIPDPLPSTIRKSPSPTVPWKTTVKDASRPTPSISLLRSNIRSEFRIY